MKIFFKCLYNILKKGPFDMIKEIFQKTYRYAQQRWLDFYSSARALNPSAFADNFKNKAWNGVNRLVGGLTSAVSTIRSSIRGIFNSFKKFLRLSEARLGSYEYENVVDDILRTSYREEKEYQKRNKNKEKSVGQAYS